MILDTKLDFSLHLKNVQNTVNKTIGLFRKLQDTLPRTSLITNFKSFIRPHFDYGDIIYDRAYNTSFHQNIESIQYNPALAITGAVRGTSRENSIKSYALNLFNKNAGKENFFADSK